MAANNSGSSQEEEDPFSNELNVMKVLISTDNHLGYLEKDPIRGEDSFLAFEEILMMATTHEVDLILLGGDLFHDNKPSRETMLKTMNLLRKHCLGDGNIQVDILSDQSINFSNAFNVVNYQDPNYNIRTPVFSIHGNHDDPSGPGNHCALDLLSAAGLCNYFGKQELVDDIEIKPILLRKGTTNMALYGLGNVRDERLNRTFKNKKVSMYRPLEDINDWFSLLVLHQNRIAHSANNYIPESFLDPFLNLVFWGHEHECRITPEQIDRDSIIITQPGSSVATSLCEGEAVAKHVGLLKIAGMEFKLKKLPIKSVRPFRMETIVLSEIEDLDRDDKVAIQINLEQKVRQMIKKVKLQWKEDNPTLKPSEFPLPLIRLKIDYSDGFSTVSPFRIGQTFINEIANPKDLIAFFRKRQPSKKKTEQMTDINDINELLPDDVEDMVESLIQHNLKDAELKILPVAELTDSIAKFVTKQETNAVSEFVNRTMEETFGNLELEDFGDDIDLANAISQARDFRSRQYAETQGEKQESQNPLRRKYDFKNTEEVKVKSLGIVPDFGFEDDVVLNTKRTMTSKGKAPAKRANPRKKTKIDEDEDEDEQSEIEEEEEEEEVVVEKPKRKRAAPKTALKTAPKPRKVAAKSTKTILKPATTKHTENTIPNPFTQATIISSEDEPIDDIAEIKDISQPPSVLQYQSGSQRNVRKIQSTLNFGSSKELGCSVDTQAKPRRTKKNPFA